MKTLTFIGGSGFFGKSYIDSFNRGKLKKLGISKLNIVCRHPQNILSSNLDTSNITIIKGNIQKLKKLPKSDYIIYGAENSNLSKKNFKKNLIEAKKSIDNFYKILANNKKNIKILYISSGAIYMTNSNYNLQNFDKNSAYIKIKRYSEEIIFELRKKHNVSIARCFTFVGPYMPLKKNFAIGNFIYDGFNNKKIKIKSNKKVLRSYMFADDLSQWLSQIVKLSSKKCPIINVGSDEIVDLRDVGKIIGKFFDKVVNFPKKKIKNYKIDKYVPITKKYKQKYNLKLNFNLKQSILLTINRINEKKN